MADDLEALKAQIRAAFPPEPFAGDVTTCGCEECRDYQREMRFKSWDQVPVKFLDFTCSPTLLEPEAYRAFLPAYMLRALDNLHQDSVVREFTVYSMTPDMEDSDENELTVSDRLLERAGLMSADQIQAIRSFLAHVDTHAYNSDWLTKFIVPALERVWVLPAGKDAPTGPAA